MKFPKLQLLSGEFLLNFTYRQSGWPQGRGGFDRRGASS